MTRTFTLLAAMSCGAIVTSSLVAHAEVEIGVTAGIHVFSDTNELGVDDVPGAPSPTNSLLVGVRLGWYFHHMLGIEGEFGVLPTNARELDYNVTAITYRGQLVAQFRAKDPANKLLPFLLVGGGAFQTVSTDPDMPNNPLTAVYKDTDGAFYVGAGIKFRGGDHWGLRLDGRALFVPSSENDMPPSEDVKKITTDFEALASVYVSFGGPKKEAAPPPPPPIDEDPDKDGIKGAADQCPVDPEDKDAYQDDDGCSEPDNDSDGILDAADKCPNEAEDKDGFQDDDGCPELDNDADGLADNQDQCPNEPEDKDGFQDEDGCPDPDNDTDGVLDATDKCPTEAETKNGFQDEDGCPDELPAKVKQFSGVVKGINFKTGSADLLKTSNKTLDKAVAVLKEFPDLKMEIQGHTDDVALKPKKGAKYQDNTELSQGRADSVRAYFISKGIAEDRITSKGYGDTAPVVDPNGLKGAKLKAARAKNRRVEFKLISSLAKP
ncbi:MAG: OmpA family protein [Kofleriaceae bacterium]|nr:OmpA family protein [Kofleriaceae bacterium]